MILPGLEPGTLLMLGACDDHYTTESTVIAQQPPLLSLIIIETAQGKKFQGHIQLYIQNNWVTHVLACLV